MLDDPAAGLFGKPGDADRDIKTSLRPWQRLVCFYYYEFHLSAIDLTKIFLTHQGI